MTRWPVSRQIVRHSLRHMNTEMSKRGALIVFEGCDRCGKTTQCKKLVEVLKNEKENVQLRRFPGILIFLLKILNGVV